MLLTDALDLSQRFIATRETHEYYVRCCELADKYKALITGENIESLLRRFVRREDDEAFAQRIDLTIAITPAVTASLMRPFNKVLRNDKVKKHFDFKSKSRNDVVQQMREGFYGRRRTKNKGFDYWLKTRYPMLQFVDPNSWVVYQWSMPESPAAVLQPRPYEVPSCNAWNWEIDNEEPQWLWVHNDIAYKKLSKTQGQKIKDARANAVFTDECGDRFTLYDTDYTITYTQVDPEYLRATGYTYAANEELWQEPTTKTYFLKRVYEPKLGFPPVFRVGYEADVETNGATCVNGWHVAMPFLMKSVKTVSEMDLTMALHTFPQKMQYVQRCPGESKSKRCDYGRIGDGQTCKACKGSGYKVHTTAQDAIYFPFPSDGATNNEVLDLEKLLVYKSPPVDLITFQKTYIEYLTRECTNAVFTQTQQVKATGPNGSSGNSSPVTATEINMNSEGVQDAVFPFTEKWRDIWIDGIYIMGALVGIPDFETAEVTCVFPSSLKIKSLDDLLGDLKAAKDSGAPSFLIDQINNDIAELVYAGDTIAELMYKTRHKFYPFNGQTADEVAFNVSSQYVTTYTKVLYANFEAIFQEIDLENPGFWFLSYDAQAPIVAEMVQAYIDEIAADSPMSLTLPGDTPPPDNNPPGDPAPAPDPAPPTPPPPPVN